MSDELLNRLVNKFLAWPLPDSVCSDLCATKQGYPHRSGTTLLSATEARQMLEYLLTEVLDTLTQQAQEIERLKDELKEAEEISEWYGSLVRRASIGTKETPSLRAYIEQTEAKLTAALARIRELEEATKSLTGGLTPGTPIVRDREGVLTIEWPAGVDAAFVSRPLIEEMVRDKNRIRELEGKRPPGSEPPGDR